MRVLAAELHLVPKYAWMPFDRRNARRREYLGLLDDLVNTAREERVDAVILPGDVFDSNRPSYPVMLEFARAVKKLGEMGVRVIAVPGNHDRYREERRKGPLDFIAEVTSLELIHTDDVFRGLPPPCVRVRDSNVGMAFCGLGHMPFVRDPMTLLPPTPPVEADKHYLVTHYTFKGFNPYSPTEPQASVPPDWVDFVIAGHIHKREWLLGDKGVYVGLAERIGFGEEGLDVGFTLIDFPEGSVNHVNREARPFLSFEIEMPGGGDLTEFLLGKLEELASDAGEMKPVVRLILEGRVPETVRDTLNVPKVLEAAYSRFFAAQVDTRNLETDIIIQRPAERIDPRKVLEEVAERYKENHDPETVREALNLILEVLGDEAGQA